MAAHYDIGKSNTAVRALQDSVMSYSVALAICFCCFLCATKAQGSTEDDRLQGINDVAADFRSLINRTTSSVGHLSKWVWKPLGNERNSIEFGPGIGDFKHYSGSGDYEAPINATQLEKSWIVNETRDDAVIAGRSLKTFDRKRNKTAENMYLLYEKHLKQTNWCFKDTEDTKPNSKFKVNLTIIHFISFICRFMLDHSL